MIHDEGITTPWGRIDPVGHEMGWNSVAWLIWLKVLKLSIFRSYLPLDGRDMSQTWWRYRRIVTLTKDIHGMIIDCVRSTIWSQIPDIRRRFIRFRGYAAFPVSPKPPKSSKSSKSYGSNRDRQPSHRTYRATVYNGSAPSSYSEADRSFTVWRLPHESHVVSIVLSVLAAVLPTILH